MLSYENNTEENYKSNKGKSIEYSNSSKTSKINNEDDISHSINNPILIQLLAFGYDPIYSKRIIEYFHPNRIEEALNYLSIDQGVIQHRYIKNKNINNITCYICGKRKEIHLDYIPENEEEDIKFSNNPIIIHKNKFKKINIYKDIEINNIKYNFNQQKICEICSELFIPNNQNTVKECGHSYCNSCWYDFFSVKIQENQLTSIKCLNNECQKKLNDTFIMNLLNNNNELIKKYNKYKLEYEILNNPNKKSCPFPNCDSYLELKNPKVKNVTCLNNHTFCFFCLQKPHRKLPCKEKLDKSIIEFSKKNFVKRCPNCYIVTEKNSGCNHIICAKCKYQWCWLCNEKYTYEHYLEGKCRGYQFFRPKDENEIQLAFEGKINLRDSQRQEDINYNLETGRILRRGNLRDIPHFEHNIRYNCCKTSLTFFIYLIFGHSFYSLKSMPYNFMRKKLTKILIYSFYFFMEISYFLQIIFFNIVMLLPYLINHGFNNFIHYCINFNRYSRQTKIYYSILLIVLNLFFGGFIYMLLILYNIDQRPKKYVQMVFVLISAIFLIIYFPLQLLVNLMIFIYLIIKERSHILSKLNGIIVFLTGVHFIRDIELI